MKYRSEKVFGTAQSQETFRSGEHQTDRLNVSRTVDGNLSVIIDEKKEIKLLLFDFEK